MFVTTSIDLTTDGDGCQGFIDHSSFRNAFQLNRGKGQVGQDLPGSLSKAIGANA